MVGAAYTMVGLKHEKNQDSYYIDFDKKSGLFIVADGMGGHAAGDIASKIAVDLISENLKKYSEKNISDVIDIANGEILNESKKSSAYEGMGTTLAMCCVDGNKAYIAHIGDSRVYLIEDNVILQLTRDHSYVQQLVDKGEISEEEAKKHSMKNIITKALGVMENIEPDIVKIKLKQNNIILICSDGVSNVLTDEELKKIALENNVEDAAQNLCVKAQESGSNDDLTAIVITIN